MTRPGTRWLGAALAAAAVGVLAGCGSAQSSAARPAVDGSATAPASARSATASAPVGTVSATTPAATSTTPNPDLPGTGKPRVLLGDMNTTEQFIIGQLYSDALIAQGYTVQLARNIGTTEISEAAMAQGSLDVYPEYLNVYDTAEAGDADPYPTLSAAFAAGQTYARAHGEVLLAPTPFANTAGIVVLSSFARAHALHSMADLSRVQNLLILGSPAEFSIDPDGLGTLERAYDFAPALTTPIIIGAQYRQLANGLLTAAYDQTTDGSLSNTAVYTNLPDSRHVLGFGNVVPVVSAQTIAAEGPAFATAIDQVDALLTDRAIRGLVAEVGNAPEPANSAVEVAKEFLQGNGLLPLPPWSTVTTTTPLTPTSSLTDTTPLTSTGRLSATLPGR